MICLFVFLPQAPKNNSIDRKQAIHRIPSQHLRYIQKPFNWSFHPSVTTLPKKQPLPTSPIHLHLTTSPSSSENLNNAPIVYCCHLPTSNKETPVTLPRTRPVASPTVPFILVHITQVLPGFSRNLLPAPLLPGWLQNPLSVSSAGHPTA